MSLAIKRFGFNKWNIKTKNTVERIFYLKLYFYFNEIMFQRLSTVHKIIMLKTIKQCSLVSVNIVLA